MKRAAAFFALLGAALALDLHAAGPLPPVEAFLRLPQYAAMQISPDGKHIAALAPVNGRQNLVVLDIPPKEARALSSFEDKDVVAFGWLNDKRLLLRTGSVATRDTEARGGGLFAVDADGGESRLVAEGVGEHPTRRRRPFRLTSVLRTIPGTDDFIGQEHEFGESSGVLFRIDSRTGQRASIVTDRPGLAGDEQWVVDKRGVPRVQIATDKAVTRIWYRASAETPWQKLDEAPAFELRWRPLAVAEDDTTLYVSSSVGRDKAAIVRYDPVKRAFGEVVAEHPQVDLDRLVMDHGDAVGVAYEEDRHGTAMFDAGLARLQATVDAAFPRAVNLMSWSSDRSWVVVTSYSDVSPGSFYLLDVKKGLLQFLADRAPWIKPANMAPMKPVRYVARDGLEIPAYLTLPRGGSGKNLPMIVDVHDGPWSVGDTWHFDREAQFFASRGYAVLQPNFRGTDRFGWRHLHASYGQWGLAMQDDITDGVKWAIAQGIADPKRVCIYGASYGGYAAIMGLARTPELYRCAVDYSGVTDLPLMLTTTWQDSSSREISVEHMKRMVGDPGRDAGRLAETSPVNLAARIKVPVLMAYGGGDAGGFEHGTRMRDALEKAGAKYQWMVMDGEGHGFRDLKNQKAFYEAVEKFFAENLGPN